MSSVYAYDLSSIPRTRCHGVHLQPQHSHGEMEGRGEHGGVTLSSRHAVAYVLCAPAHRHTKEKFHSCASLLAPSLFPNPESSTPLLLQLPYSLDG